MDTTQLNERLALNMKVAKKYEDLFNKYGVKSSLRPALGHLIENQFKRLNDMKQLSETNVSGDVAKIEKNIMPMLIRGWQAMVAPELLGHQPLNADQGVFFYRQIFYTGDSANAVKPASGTILILADATNFPAGTAIATNGAGAGKGTVRFKEDNTIFVELTSGTFAAGDSVDDANPYVAEVTTVSAVYQPEVAMYVFKNLSGFSTIANGEAATTAIKELELAIGKDTVTAISHKYRLKYTFELLNSLRDYHSLNGEQILDSSTSEALAQEMNQSVFGNIDTWATAGGVTAYTYSSADGRWEIEKYKNLIAKLCRQSASIQVQSKMGLGNYIVIDPTTWARLSCFDFLDTSMIPGGIADPNTNAFVGVLAGRFRVYVNSYQLTESINMGYKDFSGSPDSETKAGAFFCPYLPVHSVGTIDNGNGQPVKYYTTFYNTKLHPFATKNGGNAFFRKMTLSGLPS